MKKLLIALLVTLPFWGFAQIEKGNWLLGGSATFSSIKYDGAKERLSSFTFSPNAGYFLTNHIAVGLDFSVTSRKKFTFIGANPFGRFYWKKAFIQAKYVTNTATGNNSSRGFDLSIGRAFFLKPNVAFEPEFYYQSIKGYNDFSDLGLRMGFQFYW